MIVNPTRIPDAVLADLGIDAPEGRWYFYAEQTPREGLRTIRLRHEHGTTDDTYDGRTTAFDGEGSTWVHAYRSVYGNVGGGSGLVDDDDLAAVLDGLWSATGAIAAE